MLSAIISNQKFRHYFHSAKNVDEQIRIFSSKIPIINNQPIHEYMNTYKNKHVTLTYAIYTFF